MAGVTPKIIPTRVENPKESKIDHQVIVVVKNLPIINDMPIPKIMPMIPPKPERVIASIKNWFLISEGLAPTAFRSPISLVRSVTEKGLFAVARQRPFANQFHVSAR